MVAGKVTGIIVTAIPSSHWLARVEDFVVIDNMAKVVSQEVSPKEDRESDRLELK